jgi:hypothetical protein
MLITKTFCPTGNFKKKTFENWLKCAINNDINSQSFIEMVLIQGLSRQKTNKALRYQFDNTLSNKNDFQRRVSKQVKNHVRMHDNLNTISMSTLQ